MQSFACAFTMLIAYIPLLFVQGARSTSAVVEVAWHSAPNERGTWDLVVSCVLTLMICVWSALHLNVPTHHSRLRDRNIRRLRWILLGIFAPEVVVSTAFAQYLTARWLLKEIQGDIEYRKNLVSADFTIGIRREGFQDQLFGMVVGLMTNPHTGRQSGE